MIRIVDQAGVLIEKNGFRLLERDAMLCNVGPRLARIPGRLDIAHSIILAISGALWTEPLDRQRNSTKRAVSPACQQNTDIHIWWLIHSRGCQIVMPPA
jgi:hypothetical protein